MLNGVFADAKLSGNSFVGIPLSCEMQDLYFFTRQMRRLRQDHWRMLGNGYCTRPDGVTCEYETICESCPCFSTTVEFLPILNKQKQDAENKGQTQRVEVFARLIQNMDKSLSEANDMPS